MRFIRLPIGYYGGNVDRDPCPVTRERTGPTRLTVATESPNVTTRRRPARILPHVATLRCSWLCSSPHPPAGGCGLGTLLSRPEGDIIKEVQQDYFKCFVCFGICAVTRGIGIVMSTLRICTSSQKCSPIGPRMRSTVFTLDC